MKEFLAPVLTLTGLGLFFALVLAWAAQKFAVIQDLRVQKVLDQLPGANCGACGKAGCAAFAEDLARGQVDLSNCKACSAEDARKIGEILGVKVSLAVKQVITLRCQGGKNAADKYIYQGVGDCQAAINVLGGPKSCNYACVGFADCVRACPFGALNMGEDGLPIINHQLCTGCGKCVAACPRNLMALAAENSLVYVGCSSMDPAKVVIKVCKAGCIACRKCEKECPFEAIEVIDNLAVIDYDKCTSCGKCIKVCPKKIILWRRAE